MEKRVVNVLVLWYTLDIQWILTRMCKCGDLEWFGIELSESLCRIIVWLITTIFT